MEMYSPHNAIKKSLVFSVFFQVENTRHWDIIHLCFYLFLHTSGVELFIQFSSGFLTICSGQSSE